MMELKDPLFLNLYFIEYFLSYYNINFYFQFKNMIIMKYLYILSFTLLFSCTNNKPSINSVKNLNNSPAEQNKLYYYDNNVIQSQLIKNYSDNSQNNPKSYVHPNEEYKENSIKFVQYPKRNTQAEEHAVSKINKIQNENGNMSFKKARQIYLLNNFHEYKPSPKSLFGNSFNNINTHNF